MREARCQQTVALWLRSVCGTERSSVPLEKKMLPLQALGFSDTLEQRKDLLSVPCYCLFEDLASPILLHVWKYVCLVTKCKPSQHETGCMPFMLCRMLANHWCGNVLLCYSKSLLCQKYPVSDQSVFFHTTLQISPMIHAMPYLFLGYLLSVHLNC